MKKYLLAVALFLSGAQLNAQFALEHSYTNTLYFDRVQFSVSGEKYYAYNSTTKTLHLYNSDHSPWKSIPLPLPANASVSNLLAPGQTTINADTLVEFAFAFSVSGTSEAKVINENGVELLSIPGCYSLSLNTINGISKLMARIHIGPDYTTKVYTLPGLFPEHTYGESLQRVNLELSGEKYFFLYPSTNQLVFHNADHSFWKTVNPYVPSGYILGSVIASETKFNSDSLLEVIFTYYSLSGAAAVVISETGNIIDSIANVQVVSISEVPGFPDKLMAYPPGGGTTVIYSLPSLTTEHVYTGVTNRKNLEVSGSKYYNYTTGAVNIYNDNHTLWKSVPVSVPGGSAFMTGSTVISELAINTDSLVEVFYATSSAGVYQANIVEENGTLIQSFPTTSVLRVSQLPGLENKLIGYTTTSTRNIYTLPTVTPVAAGNIKGIEASVYIYPNPCSDELNIVSAGPVLAVELFDISGKKTGTFLPPAASSLNLKELDEGIYILRIFTGNSAVTKKIIINHSF